MALDFPDSPINGQEYEGFVYNSTTGAWRVTKDPATPLPLIDYRVVGGGGGGSGNHGAGGGAGGYLSSFDYAFSGDRYEPENPITALGTYTITVGAGGAASTDGSSSVLGTAIALGGGSTGYSGTTGGGAAGAGLTEPSSTAGQGRNGAFGGGSGVTRSGGGGGGAWNVGGTTGGSDGGEGGDGATFTHGTVQYAVAGGGGGGTYQGPTGGGGLGGGGLGASGSGSQAGGAGTVNTGGGGGGGAGNGGPGGAGGSGVVFLKIPTSRTVVFSAGVTQTSETVNDYVFYRVTATSTTSETVTVS